MRSEGVETRQKMDEGKTIEDVKLSGTGVVVLPRADVRVYIGKEAEIGTVSEHKGQYGYFIKVSTKPLGLLKDETGKVMEDKEGVQIQAVGSRIFSLKKDKEGKVGWTEKSDLADFLKKHDCKHYNDLKGKKLLVQGRDDKGTTFLTVI